MSKLYILFNGKVITCPEKFGRVTIPCQGTKMETDIVMFYGDGFTSPPITFTIAGTEYQAANGMTWEEWVTSEYNTEGWRIHTEYDPYFVMGQNTPVPVNTITRGTYSGGSSDVICTDAGVVVYATNVIQEGVTYSTKSAGHT